MTEAYHLNTNSVADTPLPAPAEGAAKLRSLTHIPQDGTAGTIVLVREWIALAADLADNAYASTGTTTVSSPKADGQEYSGTWNVGEVRMEEGDDRQVTLVQTLVKQDASTLTVTYPQNEEVDVTVIYYWSQTRAAYAAVVAAYQTAGDVAGQDTDISPLRSNNYGLYDFTVTKRVYNDQSITAYTAVKTQKYSATREIFKNKSSAPTLSETYGELRHVKTPQGRYDGEKQVFTYYNYDDAELVSSGYSGGTGITYTVIEKQVYPTANGYRWRKLVYTYNFGYRSSRATAESEITGGLKGSFTRHVTGRIWEWKKITTLAVHADGWQTGNLAFS